MLIIAAALAIALVLSAYTVHTILAYQPRHARRTVVAQNVGQPSVAPLIASLPHQPIFLLDAEVDWKQVAEDSLTHSQHGVRVPYIPTGAEFDAAEALNIAAQVDDAAPAKRVRVHMLATDLGVGSKFLRGVMEHQFGIATKSASSTVSAQEALTVTEFFHTHADV